MAPFFGSSVWLLTLPNIKEMDMSEELEVSELQSLKEIASNMNIKVGNIKDVDKIKAMIAEAQEPKVEPETKLTGLALKAAKRKEAKERLTKLHRVTVVALSPFHRQLKAVTQEFSNKFVGEVHRVIPFDVETHVEECLLNQLKDKVYRSKVETKDPVTGRPKYHNEFRPAFGIHKLDALTKEELAVLAADQKSRNAVD